MTNSQPRRPSAIRRRPQQPSVQQSVEEFIHSGTENDTGSEALAPEPPPPPPPAAPQAVAAPMPVTPPPAPALPHHPPHKRSIASIALFFAVCAFGLSLFSLYHLFTSKPLGNDLQPVINGVPVSATPQEHNPVENPIIIPSPPPSESPNGIQGVQWLALTELQFARHYLLLGLNNTAMDSLTLAKIHLTMLGEPFAAETTALDRIISELQNTTVLALEQLNNEIEDLKDTWLQVTFGTTPANEGLLSWIISSNQTQQRQEGRSELETTDIGRYLVARLDRIKWLALWGDESGLRQVSASLENFLGAKFLNSPEAKNWLIWLRGLQRLPLRHDVTELNALIVRLSRISK